MRLELLARAALAVLVGFGFVAPTVGAVAELVGLQRPLTFLLGVAVGAGVAVLILRSGRWEE